METQDPKLLCSRSEKAHFEAANGLEQIEYISELIGAGAEELRERDLLRLHELAVQRIYPCAGSFRAMGVTVGTHKPPNAALVRALSADAIEWINRNRGIRPALERAAYALWRFNWIHPFAGGNGRTSRALAYLIVCMEDGVMMPGKPTMPALIYKRRGEYVAALREADAADRDGREDFSKMVEFLREILMEQFAAAIDRLSSR